MFGQDNNHSTIRVQKPNGETIDGIFYADTSADIRIGDRIVHDGDTISKSIIVKAKGISVIFPGKDVSITYFTYVGSMFYDMFEGRSEKGVFPDNHLTLISNAPKGSYLLIKKVFFKTASGVGYVINNNIGLKLGVPDPTPPPPPDTTKKWESKFTISVNGISKGRISKKELMNAKTVDITGPYDSIAIRAFTMTLIYNTKDMYTSSQAQKSDQLSSQTNGITVGQYALIKKAPANTSFIISEIRYRINGKEYSMKKNLTLVIQ